MELPLHTCWKESQAEEYSVNPHQNRRGEQGHFPFRSDRFCQENGQWYFHTREGTLVGPFKDMPEARKALAVFVAEKIQESEAQNVQSSDRALHADEGFQSMVAELIEFFRSRSNSGETAALAWARNRIAKLRGNRDGSSSQMERIDILLYVMDQDQRFGYR